MPAVLGKYRSILAYRRANATVVHYLAVLSHAFTMAMLEWQWCEGNSVRKISKPRELRGRVRFLSVDQRERILNACTVSRCPYLYSMVVLALSTGPRREELLSLHWLDVDMKRGLLTLPVRGAVAVVILSIAVPSCP